ncbi:unnamed protein product [Fraxinus pennsylvanica]|uniref:sphingolipid 4-desaturase n=1 Tax=Fraxinus pennsylvanica TaxID=56036 RepID=A0AAD1YXA3_9LAMI|nr:unnamed protein product [Fraxinus pennsylvanica]
MGFEGKQREEEGEGVMATDFFWSYTDEPHASRRRQILSQYPQIKQLFGPDPFAFLKIAMVVVLQLWTATYLHNAGWLKILIVAYFFGSFLNHNLFLAIHELSHNLAFSKPVYNRWLGIFANLPIGVPMSVTFQKYHLEHHRFQGVDGVDMDIPTLTEAHLVKNIVSKSIWVILQLFFYALRPIFIKPKPPGIWEFVNLIIQLALDAVIVHFWGWKSFGYLILSTFVGGGMHPMAGHFISEHYVFKPDQETYSYYGPLNLMTWSVGYHNEHHDFPRIAGTKLRKVREIAPEFYDNLDSYKSWSQVVHLALQRTYAFPNKSSGSKLLWIHRDGDGCVGAKLLREVKCIWVDSFECIGGFGGGVWGSVCGGRLGCGGASDSSDVDYRACAFDFL